MDARSISYLAGSCFLPGKKSNHKKRILIKMPEWGIFGGVYIFIIDTSVIKPTNKIFIY